MAVARAEPFRSSGDFGRYWQVSTFEFTDDDDRLAIGSGIVKVFDWDGAAWTQVGDDVEIEDYLPFDNVRRPISSSTSRHTRR
ncbi:MAG: hypothetical protein AAGD33_24200 [Actinomycetota bacterium]